MKRGEIWTVAGGNDYAGKPRPVVIVQDDSFGATDSIAIRAFTTDESDAPLFRLAVEPNERNGLRFLCRLTVDKITAVSKSKVGGHVGRLDGEDMARLNQAMMVFLGLAVRFSRKGAQSRGFAASPRRSGFQNSPPTVAAPLHHGDEALPVERVLAAGRQVNAFARAPADQPAISATVRIAAWASPRPASSAAWISAAGTTPPASGRSRVAQASAATVIA